MYFCSYDEWGTGPSDGDVDVYKVLTEMRESRGTDRAVEDEANNDLSRGGLQWEVHQDSTLPRQEVSGVCQARDLQNTGNGIHTCYLT